MEVEGISRREESEEKRFGGERSWNRKSRWSWRWGNLKEERS